MVFGKGKVRYRTKFGTKLARYGKAEVEDSENCQVKEIRLHFDVDSVNINGI